MPVRVAWVNYNPQAIARGYWDNELPERILRGAEHWVGEWPPLEDGAGKKDGCVVVIPGQHNWEYVDEINAGMGKYPWVVVMVTGDEEGLFPWDRLKHPNMRRWAYAPNSDGAFEADRLLPFGPTPHGFTDSPKTLDWFFAGQTNTPERKTMVEALRGLDGGRLVESAGFAKGLPIADYVTVMNQARVVPCPPAWKHPDSFRVWEALDAGAIPLVDAFERYWYTLGLYEGMEGLIRWSFVDAIIDGVTPIADQLASIFKAWWLGQQYEYRRWLRADILSLGGADIAPPLTVLMPTSPIASHPDTAIIEQTIQSVRDRTDAPILVMADGIRPEQEHYRERYNQYLRELVRLADRWPNIIPVVFDEFTHQANMTRRTLDLVDSAHMMFVEHDTPLVGDIPFDRILADIPERFDVVRLLHESDVLKPHAYLHDPPDNGYVPTRQWSQRPHIATTGYYRRIIAEHFRPEAKTMIEDTMHGAAQTTPGEHRIGIFYPEGDKKRSTHLDGRGADPKYEMIT